MPLYNEEVCEAGKKKYNDDRGVRKDIFFLVLHHLKKHVLLVKIKNPRCLMNSSTDIDWISIFLKT